MNLNGRRSCRLEKGSPDPSSRSFGGASTQPGVFPGVRGSIGEEPVAGELWTASGFPEAVDGRGPFLFPPPEQCRDSSSAIREGHSLNLVVLQSISRTPERGPGGGGQVSLVIRMTNWATQSDVSVWSLANELDFSHARLPPSCRRVTIPTLGIRDSAGIIPFAVETLLSFFVQRQSLRRFCRAHRWLSPTSTVLIAASVYPTEILAVSYLRHKTRAPAAAYVHHIAPPPWFYPTRRGPLLRVVINWAYAQFSLVLMKIFEIHPLVQDEILRPTGWRFAGSKAVVHPATMEVPAGSLPAWQDRPIAACYVGRIQEAKGILDLVRAWPRVVLRRPGARLVIAGRAGGPQPLGRLLEFVRKEGLSDVVEVRGAVTEEEKIRLLESSKLLVLPSYEEGWSLSAMEAATRGAVPVLYNLPAFSYLGARCVRVPVGDIPALADAIVSALETRAPSEGISSEEIRGWLSRYSPSVVAGEELEFFRTLTNGQKGVDRD